MKNNKKEKKWSLREDIQRRWQLYLMLLLPVAWLVIFCYVPMGGIVIAFKDYSFRKGVFGSEWVGMKYFEQFFTNPDMARILKNTLILSLYQLAATFPAPIILALALHIIGGKHFKKFMQSLTYAPYFISTVVLVGIMLQCLHLNVGIVNTLLDMIGLERIDFMGKASYFRHIFVWSSVWQTTGYSAIIYIAALGNVDQSLVEASLIDGANRLQRIRIVELPALKPIITIQLILAVGNIMSLGFDKVILMQNNLNMNVSEIISTYVYKRGLRDMQYSFATAVGLFNSVVNFILLFLANKLSQKFGETSLW
ncbi:MAG TPA: ABC transporter permease subunit [Candidatus Eisenbergiella merdavium]|uniref:ABC transporter permease subunit n=1 Tax=Candidatus Eisenbergiella merdavium TaxID=2838551 RepID=A0A9D2NIQ6_9FIRM|nr:ABC transporter permease subunit [Candidatus Eisenbergiella merdavium]